MTDIPDVRSTYSRQAEKFKKGFAKSEERSKDPEFRAYCEQHLEWLQQRQAELDAMFTHSDEVGLGSMFENAKGDSWAIVFPDASKPGRFRYQECKAYGWLSHSTFDTFDQVIYEAHAAGFVKPVSTDLLDKLSNTAEWKKGMEITCVVDQMNRRQITHEEGNRLITQINERYAVATAAGASSEAQTVPEPEPVGQSVLHQETARTQSRMRMG